VSGGAGAEVTRDGRGRRIREQDSYGEDVATLTWADDGRLDEARVRLPDGGWLTVQPRGATDPRWGLSDLLCRGEIALTHCAAIEWGAVDAIPPLAEPARLPPGGGTAVLNLIASLAADQGRAGLAYRGPYPTEQLFLALIESFDWDAGDEIADPLAAFMAGQLRWAPAPHARALAPGGVYVQSRRRVEKLVWRDRTYHRAEWRGIRRHTTHRVHEVDGRVHGSLWALDAPLEVHLVLTPDGRVLTAALPPVETAPPQPLAPVIAAGLAAVVVASSAPPLAASIRAVAADLRPRWAPLTGDLAVLAHRRIDVSTRLRRALGERLTAAAGRVEQVRLGFATLAELGLALGDALRSRAQTRLAMAMPAEQEAALEMRSVEAVTGAREIGAAVEALLVDVGQLRA
jgi:hypothetical protein